MKPRVCLCCGEFIHEQGNALSRNPNVCASCSSMADGMEEPTLPDRDVLMPEAWLVAKVAERTAAQHWTIPKSSG